MPGFLVTTGTQILCAHGGKVYSVGINPRVKIMGQPALFQSAPGVIAGCSNPPPPASIGLCITAYWPTGSLRVRSMGQPLLLMDSQSVCMPTGTPATIVPAQMRVKGI
jgi:hypothetical protein